MPNMAVQYRGPNPALLTLTKELRARFGDPARTYEFVTGYKSPGNYSGHNPDNNGTVHAVDIFVGTGNLTAAQGMDTAERIRLEGQRGDTPGVPARVFYLIHNRRIAGGSEGWAWRPYTGADPHTDHIHVSTADTYWGDPVALDPSNYNTTAPWNLWGTTKPQSGTVTPIKEDAFMALSDKEQKELLALARQIAGYTDTKISAVAGKVWTTPVIGRKGGPVGALQELADIKTKVLGLEPVITSIAAQTDPARIAEMIPDDIAAQVIAALSIRLADGAQ